MVFKSHMIIRKAQEVVTPLVSDAGMCTSYPRRHVLPTVSLHVGFVAAARRSLGNWQGPSLALK
eukprot:4252976-Karenia_brevis.AAC.1